MSAQHGLGLGGLAGNAAATLARQIAAGLAQLATVVVIARALGPQGNGQHTLALLLPTTLATLLALGIGPANVYFLASRQFGQAAVLRGTARLAGAIVVAGLALGAVLIGASAERLFPGVPAVLLWVGLAVFPFALFQTLLSSIFQGLQRFRTFNLVLLAQPCVTLAIVLALAAAGAVRIELTLAAYLAGYVATAGVGFVKLHREADGTAGDAKRTEAAYEKAALGYGAKVHLGNILAFVNYKADLFLVNLLLGPAAAGLYIVAVQLVERIWLLSQAASTVLLPRLSELAGDESARRQITPIVCRSVLAVSLLAAAALAAIGYPVLALLFGDAYRASFLPLLLLLPGIVAGSAARIMAADIAARGRPELNLYFSLVSVTANVIGNLLLIPPYGIAGAAVATSGAYVLNLVLRLGVYGSLTGTGWLPTLIFRQRDLHALQAALLRARR